MCHSIRVDQKGRLKIPANVHAELQGLNNEFYATSESGTSIRIYPMQIWNRVQKRLESLSLRNRNYEKFLARAKYFGQVVTIDNQGRMLIPIALRRAAQIKGAVDVLDYPSYLEVWNHTRLLKTLRSNPITAQDENLLNKQLSAVLQFPWASQSKKKRGHIAGKARRFGEHGRSRRPAQRHAMQAIGQTQSGAAERTRVA